MMHSRSGTLMLLGDAYPTYRMFTQNYCLAFFNWATLYPEIKLLTSLLPDVERKTISTQYFNQ